MCSGSLPPKNEVGLPARCKQSKEQPGWLLRLLLWCPSETRNPNAKLKNLDMAALPAIFGKGREVTLTLYDFSRGLLQNLPKVCQPWLLTGIEVGWWLTGAPPAFQRFLEKPALRSWTIWIAIDLLPMRPVFQQCFRLAPFQKGNSSFQGPSCFR